MYGAVMVCEHMCKKKVNKKHVIQVWLYEDEHDPTRLGFNLSNSKLCHFSVDRPIIKH